MFGKTLIKKNIIHIMVFVVLMIFSVNGVFNYINKLIVETSIETLHELCEHDQKAISAAINKRMTDAENLADSLESQSILSIQELHENLVAANHQLKTKRIYLLGSNGKFYSSNGTAKEDEEYSQMVINNANGFLDRHLSVSQKFDNGLLLIGKPISEFTVEGVRFSYIITETNLTNLTDELITTSYSGKGRSFVIDTDGNYIVSPEGLLQENAFDNLRKSYSISNDTIDNYIQKIINEQETSVRLKKNGEDIICLTRYTPEGWILISICPESVFSKQSNNIITLFTALTLVIVVASAIILISILRTRSRKLLEERYDQIKELNEQLVEKQKSLEELNTKQEMQIKEICAINEDISRQKKSIEQQLDIIGALAAMYTSIYYIDMTNFTSVELGHMKEVGTYDESKKGNVIQSFNMMLKQYIHIDYVDEMESFCNLSTINERLMNRNSISKQFMIINNNWLEGTFIVAKRDSVGNCLNIIWSIREITEDKAKEMAYQQELEKARDDAEVANKAKTSFLFNMSHDIRTPMNAIIGFRDLLEKHQDEPEKRRDYLQKIADASTVLLSIINNVLEMARIEKGTIEIDETAWSAEQFNDTLYSVFHEMMIAKGITFTRQIEVHNHYVFCDPIKLREIFLNILSNAYKYTNAGGSVNMHLEEITSNRDGWALYQTTISDTGIGMAEEFLPHIFEEFSRENNTTDAKVEGTGLGMPIVKRLVEMLDGTIEIHSKKGVGSTFIVTIPHKIAEKSNLVEHAGVEVDTKLFAGKHILLAEDNELNAEIAIEILSEVGFIVERAQDGAICVEMLKESKSGYYDLILMDIQMPNMNGYEATRTIRQLDDNSKANIKILAMTANAFEEDKREALSSGMNGHLTKPINVNQLMKTLARIFG